MSNEKNWLDFNLSEFVSASLKNGVIPFIQFIDKDKFQTGVTEHSVSPSDETPIIVLNNQIRQYERFIQKIKTRDGIISEGQDVDKKLADLENKLLGKIEEFKKAIDKLA